MVAIEHRENSLTLLNAITANNSATATTIENLNNNNGSNSNNNENNENINTLNVVAVLSPTTPTLSSSLSSATSPLSLSLSTTTATVAAATAAADNNIEKAATDQIQETADILKKNSNNIINNKQNKMSLKTAKSIENAEDSAGSRASTAVEDADIKDATASVSAAAVISKSAVSQRNVDIKIAKKSNMEAATQELTKKVLKLDLSGKELDDFSIKSPRSPIAARLPHQASLTSSVDVEDRKTLREALYQGIFHRHRRTIFAVGSFLRMLRSRNSQYNTIRSSSEGEDVEEVR